MVDPSARQDQVHARGEGREKITVYPARRVITMDELPDATAVAVAGDRIVAGRHGRGPARRGNGGRHLRRRGGVRRADRPASASDPRRDHLTEVIAIGDWVPGPDVPASTSAADYRQRLAAAERRLSDPDEWLFSWGYHRLWHGPLDRARRWTRSARRPVVVWQRSCHEWFLNTAAIDALGLTARGHERPRPG